MVINIQAFAARGADTRWQRNETKQAFHYARELAREASNGEKGFCRASVANGVETFARADPAFAVSRTRCNAGDLVRNTRMRTGRR